MKLNLFCMPTIPGTDAEREQLRPIGRNTDRYQMMVDELRQLAVLADEMGVDSFSTTEHHFHTEGGEANPNPLMFFTDLAARTKNLTFAPMSVVLGADNPLRVAENVALLDQLSKGRVAVALARGYQKRWMQIMTQSTATATGMGDAGDKENRDVWEEYTEILIKAWTEDAFDYNGAHFQIPFPHKDGISGWAPVEWTRRFGADGEIDENGIIRKIGVIPKPYQHPHPPVWIVSTGSVATVEQAARNGFTAFMFEPRAAKFRAVSERYRDLATEAGHPRSLGQGVGACRTVVLGATDEEAFDLSVRTSGAQWHNYFNSFGFGEGFRTEEDDLETFPIPRTFRDERDMAGRLRDLRFNICGTVDTVKRQLDDLATMHGGGGALEHLQWLWFFQGMVPFDVQARQLETFMTKVWPEFKD